MGDATAPSPPAPNQQTPAPAPNLLIVVLRLIIAHRFWAALGALLTSKKVLTTIAGATVALAARYHFNVDPQLVLGILALFGILVHAQGQTDLGREAAREAAKATPLLPGTVLETTSSSTTSASAPPASPPSSSAPS